MIKKGIVTNNVYHRKKSGSFTSINLQWNSFASCCTCLKDEEVSELQNIYKQYNSKSLNFLLGF